MTSHHPLENHTDSSGSVETAKISFIFWCLILIAVSAAVQIFNSYPMDTDTAFHAAVGKLIYHHGILHSFPWTPFSYLADTYADKELVFHILFALLAKLEYVTAAKIVGTISGACALLSIFTVLRCENIKHSGYWTIIAVICSAAFLYRFALVRPHLFSIALAVLLAWAASRKKLQLIFLFSFLYPWFYVAFWQIPLILLLIVEAARYLSGEKIFLKGFLLSFAGISAGMLLHPNGWNLITLNWVQMNNVLIQNAWGKTVVDDLGREFQPVSLADWLTRLSLALLFTIIGSWLAWRNRKQDHITLAFAIAALAFAILTARTFRFVEYFVPFSVCALAMSTKHIRLKYAMHLAFGISAFFLLFFNIDHLKSLGNRKADMNQQIAAFLQQKIPEGAQIFTPKWGFTGPFMLALPERRFIVALDPTFFYLKNPELYKLWRYISTNAPLNTPELICDRFHARYVLSYPHPDLQGFIYRLYYDARIRTQQIQGILYFDLGKVQGCVQGE